MNHRLVVRNAIWLFNGRFVTAVLNLLLTVLLARGLGVTAYGQYAFMAALAYLGNTVTTFGMDTLVMRSASQGREETGQEALAALVVQVGLTAVYILIITTAAIFWGSFSPTLFLYLLILLPLAFGTIYSAILRGAERMDLYTAYLLVGGVLQTGGVAIIVWQGGSLLGVVVWLVGAQGITAVFASQLVRHRLPQWQLAWQRLSRQMVAVIVQAGWVLAVVAILSVLFAQLPILLLRALTDDATIGQFSAASRLVDGGRMVPAAIFGALFPPLVRGAARSPRYRQLFWGLVAVFGVGILVGIWLAPWLMGGLYGEGYETAVSSLQILLLGLLPFLFRLRDSFELITQRHERHVLLVMALTILLACPIFYYLILWQPLRGASWAVVISITVQAILLYLAKRNVR